MPAVKWRSKGGGWWVGGEWSSGGRVANPTKSPWPKILQGSVLMSVGEKVMAGGSVADGQVAVRGGGWWVGGQWSSGDQMADGWPLL